MAEPQFFPLPGGLAWIADPAESMQRASAALATSDGVVIIDPVDCAGLDERLQELGPVARVVKLLDRHGRDSESVAARHGVGVEEPGREAWTPTDVERLSVVDRKRWREDALLVPATGLLLIAEAVGSTPLFRAGAEPIGIHPVLRLFPPRRIFGSVHPNLISFGHGPPLLSGADAALVEVLAHSRRRLLPALRSMLPRRGR